MLHPHAELRYINDQIGYGVFANRPIPKGTILWVLDALDQVLSPEQVAALPGMLRAQVERYGYVDSAGRYVLCWDFGRYMNHSCRPTTRGVGEAFEIAVRDVAPGDQLTCEYGVLNMSGSFACACGEASCRGTVGPDDLEALWPAWDAEAADAFRAALGVEQPLLPFARLRPEDEPLAAAIREKRMIDLPSALLYQAPASTLTSVVGAPTAQDLWRLPRASD